MTTKAQAKAAAVDLNKRTAYAAKVRTLIGMVAAQRTTAAEITAQYDAGADALSAAVTFAAREAVGAAVFPLKADAVAAANTKATTTIARVMAAMEAAGWNIDVAAPYAPRGMSPWSEEYRRINAKAGLYRSLTKEDKAATTAWHAAAPADEDARREYFRNRRPEIVMASEFGVARFVEMAEQSAAAEYDAFVCKLVSKVGDCDAASLSGSHVWSYSVLTVTKGATVEKWKTQQIWNVSKLGNEFPQWPTRLQKAR